MSNEFISSLLIMVIFGWFVLIYCLSVWAFVGRKKYETLDLSIISSDDVVLIGHDYKMLSREHSIVLHNRLYNAIFDATLKGKKIIKVDLDGYCVKIIKKQDAIQKDDDTFSNADSN